MESFAQRVAAGADPTRPAVVGPSGVLRYAELIDRASRLAGRWAATIGPVLLYGHKEPAMVVGVLAALVAGRPYVPIDAATPTGRIARILDLARPEDAVLTRDAPGALVGELERRSIRIWSLDPLAASLDSPSFRGAAPRSVAPDDEAYILFTSGTTGAPKGVRIPYRGLAHFSDWLLASQGFIPRGETFLNQAPFNFDLSVMDLYGALLTGGTLFCVTADDIADARRLFARLEGAPLTVWVSTPSFIRFCLAEPRFGAAMLPRLKRFLFCGEALPAPVLRDLYRRFPLAAVWNTYGPTETTVAATGLLVPPELAGGEATVTIGRPFPGLDVWIGDPSEPSRRVAAGERGEIIIAGPQVALGYLLEPAARGGESAFFALPNGTLAYRTGDLGHADPADGLLFWDARRDRQIKLHGYRLELGEVEARLRAIPGVADAAVLVVERRGLADHLEAFVVASGEGELPASDLDLTRWARARLAEELPRYALPRAVHYLSVPPLTANGKLDRRVLEEMLR